MYLGANRYGLFVVMATGTVHVAVGDLFFRRVANIGDLYGKIQFHTGKWMVTVDCDIVSLDCDDRYDQRLPLGRGSVKLHAGFKRLDHAKQFTRDYLLERFVAHSVPFLGCDGDLQFLSNGSSRESAFEPWDDILGTVEVRQTAARRGLVQDVPPVVGQRVIDGNDHIRSDLHDYNPLSGWAMV